MTRRGSTGSLTNTLGLDPLDLPDRRAERTGVGGGVENRRLAIDALLDDGAIEHASNVVDLGWPL